MKSRRSQLVPAAPAIVVFLLQSAMAATAVVIEHTFVVSQVNMTLGWCKEALVTVVNGQLPGPTIEITEGDSVAVHVVNESPYDMTIHWHGIKQRLNCWADGVPMITQCPIRPGHNFTYRFNVTGQEGTLWWHAHVSYLRVFLHGAFIIRPRHEASSYPFAKPHREIPLIIGEWWGEEEVVQLESYLKGGIYNTSPVAATINGKVGGLTRCSGAMDDGYVLEVEPGKTYLLRFINAALHAEHYFKIAGHKFIVVAADANYVNPYTTDIITIAPGETVDALLIADAPPGKYSMVSLAIQPTLVIPPFPKIVTRGMVQYMSGDDEDDELGSNGVLPMAPEMPDLHDTATSFYFHGNLTSLLRQPRVPTHVDERLFITLSAGSVCRQQGQRSCNRSSSIESFIVVSMNNISFELPTAAAKPLLEAHYLHRNEETYYVTLPDRPPKVFNFTDPTLIPSGPKEAKLDATEKATTARRFRHGVVVEVVFQNTAVLQSDNNPMHLHGHDMFVLAQGLGNYDASRDVARYNLMDPPVRNTVLVPSLGWAAVRFIADNPGAWFMHCHFELHLSMGMASVFIVEDGPTVDSSLPSPPKDLPKCVHREKKSDLFSVGNK